jgi:protein TonB
MDLQNPEALDRAPTVRRSRKPQYTQDAMQEKVEGRVWMQVVIGAAGRVQEIEVVRALHPSLNREALNAMARWEFTPAISQGVPVPVRAVVEMEFSLR